jgi:AcrR family transcriptional regulator
VVSGRNPQVEFGLRERNKLDKIKRIKAAAVKLFSTKGFDGTTTREIAKRARVAKGTLFLYVKDKRDLVFLIFSEELDQIRSRALNRIDPTVSLFEQLVAVFSVFYEEFSKDVTLSRILLKELLFYQGVQELDKRPHGFLFIQEIQRLIARDQEKGTVRSDVDPLLIAQYIYYINQAELRTWIWHDHPEVSEGIADLRRVLGLFFEGLYPRIDQHRP